jgi:hypothetical protein
MTDLVSQNIETQTVVSHEAIVQVIQEVQEQVVLDNQITTQVEQEAHDQTVVNVEITTQVEQETQEQVTLGTPGPRGPPGLIKWRGAYDAGTVYAKDDGVSYNGGSYVCVLVCLGVAPTETTNWSILAAAAGEWTALDMGSFS